MEPKAWRSTSGGNGNKKKKVERTEKVKNAAGDDGCQRSEKKIWS